MVKIGKRRAVAAAAILALAVVALALAGDLDTTFGADGIVDVALPGDPNWLGVDCEVRSDGRILLAGSDEVNVTYRRWAIRGFHADGSVDTSFGTGGFLTVFGTASDDNLSDISLDGSGRILAVGNASVLTTNGRKTTQTGGGAVARITASGQLDTSFGTGGAVVTQVPGASSTLARAVATQADGKIVVAGTAVFQVKGKGGSSLNAAIYLARYHANGSLDGTFGSSGIAVHDRTSGSDTVSDGQIGIQSDGRIVVGSRSGSSGQDDWVITRYLSNGAVDTGFGPITSADDTLQGLAVDATDRIVAVGWRALGVNVSDMVASRYTASGAPDTSFGSGGTALIDIDVHETLRCRPAFQSDGKIVCSGIVIPNPTTGYDHGIVLRLDADGTLDSGFGTGGVSDPIQISATFTEPWALDLAPDGGIVVAGRHDDVDPHWFLARYLAQ